MSKWEDLEEYLFERDALGEEFNNAALAEDWGISSEEATDHIQAYLGAQTRTNTNTLFVLTRTGRTKAAVWHVGARAIDARHLGRQTGQDFQRRFVRFVGPTLEAMAVSNPRAVPAAEAVAKGVEAGIELIASMLDGEA